MRKKVEDYLEKPNKKLYAQLTSLEQKFVDSKKGSGEQPKPKPQGK